MRFWWLGCIALLFTACQAPLSVRLEKIDHKHLASYHAETPDPVRCRFFKGQQAVVAWSIRKECALAPFDLKLFLIRTNHRLEVIKRRFCTQKGAHALYFLGENWCEEGEILTWRAELYAEGKLIAVAFQKPWVDWIDDRE